MPATKAGKLVRVRCLGPGKEHGFMSRDRTTERVCKTCREKLANVGMALRDRPVPVRCEER